MTQAPATPRADARKNFSSSILLSVRADQPRQAGMDYWRGPHSGIISATPGLKEYRQVHLAENNAGLWPATDGVETTIPADRKIDGLAEVTFQSALSPLMGRAQTQLAYKDEVNVFRRTLLYAGPPGSSRWYKVAGPSATVGARSLVYLRRRQDVSGHDFRKTIRKVVVPALMKAESLTELRLQTFLPWAQQMWDTPNVAHDNPKQQQFHASVILGFADQEGRSEFFQEGTANDLSPLLAPIVSAIHAYDVSTALTYVKDGAILPEPQS